MKNNRFVSHTVHGLRMAAVSLAVLQMSVGSVLAASAAAVNDKSAQTATPIKHVIVIIGENRSFDHVFATYVPRPGQTVHNLLSQGIIQLDANKNAIPGPNFHNA
jgi:phospholipase C